MIVVCKIAEKNVAIWELKSQRNAADLASATKQFTVKVRLAHYADYGVNKCTPNSAPILHKICCNQVCNWLSYNKTK